MVLLIDRLKFRWINSAYLIDDVHPVQQVYSCVGTLSI